MASYRHYLHQTLIPSRAFEARIPPPSLRDEGVSHHGNNLLATRARSLVLLTPATAADLVPPVSACPYSRTMGRKHPFPGALKG